jgi:hypothetical protein
MKMTLAAAISAFAIAAISSVALAGDAHDTRARSNSKHTEHSAQFDNGPAAQAVASSTDIVNGTPVYAQQQANVGYQASSTLGVPPLVPNK